MYQRIAMVFALALAGLSAAAPPARAQLTENLGALTEDNARKYLGPLTGALSGTMNAAVFTTGHVPKTGVTFQIGIKVMGIQFDDADRLFTPTDPPGFTGVAPFQQAPTVIGDGSAVAQDGQGGTTVYYPGGFNINEFAFAAPQLSIGSVLGTRAVVRWYAQNFSNQDVVAEIDLFGIGAQHSISQYFTDLPLDLAAGVFYQTLQIDHDLLDSEAIHFDVTGSKSFGLLQPYGALGVDTFKMDALYEDANNPGSRISVAFDRETHFHFTAGLLANFKVVQLHGEVNFAAKNGLAVGLSFGK
jgi:hypothetical protein